ncbi:MAG: hypothetical protein OHK0039_30560 [Bacteroidia bacterium]
MPDSFVWSGFVPVPGMDAAAGIGGGVRDIDAHAGSGSLLYRDPGRRLMRAHPTLAAPSSLATNVDAFVVSGDWLAYMSGNELYLGKLDCAGGYASVLGTPLMVPMPPGPMLALFVHPLHGTLYLFTRGTTPQLYRTARPLDSLHLGTAFFDILPAGLPTTFEWTAFGIAPGGRLFLGGSDFAHKQVARADDDTTWTLDVLPFGGAPGGRGLPSAATAPSTGSISPALTMTRRATPDTGRALASRVASRPIPTTATYAQGRRAASSSS